MGLPKIIHTIGAISLFLSVGTVMPSWASELSVAEAKFQELQTAYNTESEYLVAYLDYDLGRAKACVQNYESSTISQEITERQSCQSSLSALESERILRTQRVETIKVQLDSLSAEIEKLRSASGISTPSNNGAGILPTEAETAEAGGVVSNPSPITSPSPLIALERKATVVAPSATSKVVAEILKKKKTIKCYKGKLMKKVTGVKPKCPKGYRVKIR